MYYDEDEEIFLIWDPEEEYRGEEEPEPERRPPVRRRTAPAGTADGRRRQRNAAVHNRERSVERRRRRERLERRRKRIRRMRMIRALTLLGAAIIVVAAAAGLFQLGSFLLRGRGEDSTDVINRQDRQIIADNQSNRPKILEDFLTPNEYSRPGDPMDRVDNIFIHYTANPGTSAAQNRSYFENLGITGETSASAHFVIGYEGEIIQCLPLDEIGYAVKEHNFNSISIECCYLDEDGKFTDATYQSLLKLTGWLMNEYKLGPSAVQRHYDTNGKKCPLYYVEHEDAWKKLKEDIGAYINGQV